MTKLPLPRLRRVSDADRKAIDALNEHRRLHPTPLSPCALQTQPEIEDYYRNARIGEVAVVRNTQGHILQYTVSKISERLSRTVRVDNDAYYMKSGKLYRAPTGKISLVVPTPEVLAWREGHPRGEMGYTIYPENSK